MHARTLARLLACSLDRKSFFLVHSSILLAIHSSCVVLRCCCCVFYCYMCSRCVCVWANRRSIRHIADDRHLAFGVFARVWLLNFYPDVVHPTNNNNKWFIDSHLAHSVRYYKCLSRLYRRSARRHFYCGPFFIGVSSWNASTQSIFETWLRVCMCVYVWCVHFSHHRHAR